MAARIYNLIRAMDWDECRKEIPKASYEEITYVEDDVVSDGV